MTSTHELQGPLVGLRVMDLSIMAAGPWTAGLLGMLGAEVIKVEPPAGDGVRWHLPQQRGISTNFIAMNVNKKDIILDLKSREGLATAFELAKTCDILVQNFRAGVMDRLGFGYESLHQANPRLIYCAISGFGETGPLSKEGCGDPIMQAFSGFGCANGAKDDVVDAFRFTGLLDLATASVSTSSILAALMERETTGVGQKVEVSMLEAALEIQNSRIGELLGAGLVPQPRESESAGLVPDRAFATMDREIFVTVHNDAEWQGFCRGVGQEALAGDARFSTMRARVAHRDELHAILEPIFKSRPAIWWLRVFQRNDVPAGIAHHFETFRHHRQIVDNGMIKELQTRGWGEISVGGLPWHFSGTPCEVRESPQPGEHTDEILAQLNVPAQSRLSA
jgi:crotonobetainyl-CoA:carnitine CoA-transferase CaiB-like acyl-CoA transferase